MRFDRVPYMAFAKATFNRTDIHNLGTSGILKLIAPEELEIGPVDFPRGDVCNDDGLPALREAIAGRYGVAPEDVLLAEGASLANFLILAALIRPGDTAMLEEPHYGPLASVLETLDARIQTVAVDGPEGHAAILEALSKRRGPARARAVVMTNPHNPTGRRIEDGLLARIAGACDEQGATLMVDEAYREALFESPPGCAARVAPGVASTSSLTKAYGLSHLRVGWAIGPPPLIDRAVRIHDNLGVVHPFLTEAIGARIIRDGERMERWRARVRARLDANRATVRKLFEETEDLEGDVSELGILSFPRWRGNVRFPDANSLCERALSEAKIAIAPGRFFQRPDHVRIGVGGPEEKVAAACKAFAAFLSA